ncbi:PucR family transcriptional regulator [Actinocatenispora comari]|nr:PucR family transcriptional regulator [Actinocatenispora comari]
MSSTVPTTTRTAERVIERMTPGLHAMLDRMTDRRIAELPMYASAASGSRDVVWKLVAANVHEVFDRLTGRRDDLSAAERSGRLRAQQGLALADLLTSFRMGYDEVWEAMIAAARTPPAIPADDMVDLSHLMFRLHNQVGDALIHAYREEAQHILLSRERERAALVNVLLSETTSVGTVIEIAGMLRLPMDGTFVVVAAATTLGQDPLPRVDSYLSAVDVPSVWHLRQDALVGLLSLGTAARNAVALDVLARHATGPVGVSPVFELLRRAPWALGLAELVLQRHGGVDPVEQFQDTPMNVLVASAPSAAQDAARTVLGGLLDLPAERRDMLLQTLTAWVEAGGSAPAAGKLLRCHQNTVRHRLHRIELITGRSLTHPGECAEIVAACHAWTQLPHPPQP